MTLLTEKVMKKLLKGSVKPSSLWMEDIKSHFLEREISLSYLTIVKLPLRRMKSPVCRLEGDVLLLQSYDNVIQQQLAQGIIETVQDTNKHMLFTSSSSAHSIKIYYKGTH